MDEFHTSLLCTELFSILEYYISFHINTKLIFLYYFYTDVTDTKFLLSYPDLNEEQKAELRGARYVALHKAQYVISHTAGQVQYYDLTSDFCCYSD